VRGRRVADLIDRFYDGVQSGIVPDGRIGAEQVIVDRSRHSYDREIVFGSENPRSGQRPVPADYDQAGIFFILNRRNRN